MKDDRVAKFYALASQRPLRPAQLSVDLRTSLSDLLAR